MPDLRKFFVNDRKSRQIKHTPDVFSTNWNSLVEVHGVSRLLSIEFPPFPLLFILTARLDYRKRERKLDNFDFLFDLKRIVFLSREISYLISYWHFSQTVVSFCSLFVLTIVSFFLSFFFYWIRKEKRVVEKVKQKGKTNAFQEE